VVWRGFLELTRRSGQTAGGVAVGATETGGESPRGLSAVR